MHQMDVETAFLNGELEEEIYMVQPPYFVHPDYPEYVCRLLRSLYGLKQSPRQWNARFHSFMQSIHFQRLHTDVSVYIRHFGSHFVILALYVDDIVLLATSLPAMNQIKRALTATFRMSDGGELSYILGMQVLRHRPTHTMHLTQAKFAEGIVKKFNTSVHKHYWTPLPLIRQQTYSLHNEDTTLWVHDPLSKEYRSILGSIRYLVTCTRPDLAFALYARSTT
ncbi:hypothetical protein GOP47_0002382 [Adiantum capillus-veneris]|uniref:Reverse transcriptase Ty1/copia-type domain-containing protein n=1 Tax=Adiantum capillus-veneris TaxID=13818 RepID=A0A9D4VAU0_ADICA|nr:hypothetical protein GOP47_0002382 [Adiantum capillus-veneris]